MSSTRRRAALIATTVAVPAAILAGIAFAAAVHRPAATTSPTPAGPVAVVAPPRDDVRTRAICARVLGALPTTLAGHPARSVSTAPERIVAWGDPAIVLRCGVEPPAEPQGEAVIGGATWSADERDSTAVFTTKGRAVLVELSVPRAAVANPAEVVASLAPAVTGADPAKP
jgi:hypothetical protein